MEGVSSYQGGSAFLRWWPRLLVGFAVVMLAGHWNQSFQWATFSVLAAYVHARWLPCQFTILGDGLLLAFPFGRRRFLPKQSLLIRIEVVGATALVGRRHRLGYLLLDRISYEPGRNLLLRTAFSALGYDLS